MKAEYESLIVVNNKAADIYAKKGGKDAQYYKDLMAKGLGEGVWMDSTEALEHGLIDEEFVTTRAAAVWGDDIFTKLNLKAPKMTKEKNKLSGFFAGLKSLIEGYKADNPEVEIPEAITAQMADFENRAQEVEAENVRLEGEITARVTEVQSLTAQITERDATITDLTSQVSAQTAEVERLTAEVEALKVAPITLEGDDPEPAPEDKPAENSFDADAAKIRAEFQVLRIEGAIPDDDK
jgi:DNA repair exonuclease SbcCD ATPase subunit